MGLTIKMRIDEHDEHTYVFSTGDGGEIELIPLSVVANGNYSAPDGKAYNLVSVNVPLPEIKSLNITENGTYEAEDGTVWNVVNVDVEPLLQSKSVYYDTNGTYTLSPDEGKDGLSSVSVQVDVPETEPNLEHLNETITQNDTYDYYPNPDFDGFDEVHLSVDVEPVLEHLIETITQNGTYTYEPSLSDGFEDAEITVNVSGGSSDAVLGTVTVQTGTNTLAVSVPSGKKVVAFGLWCDRYTDLLALSSYREYAFFSAFLNDESNQYWYKTHAEKGSGTATTLSYSGVTQVMGSSVVTNSSHGAVIWDSANSAIKFNGKNTGTTYGLHQGYTYHYFVIFR